jgi:hypothetical protein
MDFVAAKQEKMKDAKEAKYAETIYTQRVVT